MWNIITAIPALITGLFGSINGITSAISNEKLALITAGTDQERIEAQERVNTLTLRRDVMIAEAAGGSKANSYMRLALGCCALVPLAKILVWDKAVAPFFGCVGRLSGEAAEACHMFTTDALDPNLWWVVTTVVGFYFLAETSLAVTKVFKRG